MRTYVLSRRLEDCPACGHSLTLSIQAESEQEPELEGDRFTVTGAKVVGTFINHDCRKPATRKLVV